MGVRERECVKALWLMRMQRTPHCKQLGKKQTSSEGDGGKVMRVRKEQQEEWRFAFLT